MRRLTLCERDSLPIGTDEGLSEAEAGEFAKIQPSLPAGSLTWQHRAVRFGPFCGVLRAGNVMVELLPKIDAGQDRGDGPRGLLVAMLRATGNFGVSSAGKSTLGQQRMHLLDQFILDFCTRVSAGATRWSNCTLSRLPGKSERRTWSADTHQSSATKCL